MALFFREIKKKNWKKKIRRREKIYKQWHIFRSCVCRGEEVENTKKCAQQLNSFSLKISFIKIMKTKIYLHNFESWLFIFLL